MLIVSHAAHWRMEYGKKLKQLIISALLPYPRLALGLRKGCVIGGQMPHERENSAYPLDPPNPPLDCFVLFCTSFFAPQT